MKFIITENQLSKIIESDEKQSFFNKLRQKVSLINPIKLTDKDKFKMFEFVVKSIKDNDCKYSIDWPVKNSITIYPNKEVLINGIKSTVRCWIINIDQTLENKSPENVYLEFLGVIQKSEDRTLSFLDKDNKLFGEFISLTSDVVAKAYDKKRQEDSLKKVSKIKKQPEIIPTPEPKYDNDDDTSWIRISFDDDDYRDNDDDDSHGFGGFGGGQTGGGGAGGSW
jgi:uncharacterized membrane protein YgcG